MTDYIPTLGDHVHHIPSGETWVVAWCDGKNLAWLGYPDDGCASLRDCEITKLATDADRAEWLIQIKKSDGRTARKAARMWEGAK